MILLKDFLRFANSYLLCTILWVYWKKIFSDLPTVIIICTIFCDFVERSFLRFANSYYYLYDFTILWKEIFSELPTVIIMYDFTILWKEIFSDLPTGIILLQFCNFVERNFLRFANRYHNMCDFVERNFLRFANSYYNMYDFAIRIKISHLWSQSEYNMWNNLQYWRFFITNLHRKWFLHLVNVSVI